MSDTEPEREWYRRIVIALWHPHVTRPIDYLEREHRRAGWNGRIAPGVTRKQLRSLRRP